MKAFFESLLDALSRGENAVLCSVLSASGSTPRGAGAKMAVFADGHMLGTVGGGAVERAAMEQAMRVHQGEAADMRSFCLAPNQLGGADGAPPPGSVSSLRFRRFLFPDV